MESALTTSPPSRRASATASAVFPVAVGPTTATTGGGSGTAVTRAVSPMGRGTLRTVSSTENPGDRAQQVLPPEEAAPGAGTLDAVTPEAGTSAAPLPGDAALADPTVDETPAAEASAEEIPAVEAPA